MPKLSALLAEKAKGDVQVGGSSVGFTFYVMWRERFADDEWAALMADGVPAREQWKAILPKVLVSWELVDDDEHALPATAEAITNYDVPDTLLAAIWRRIIGSELSGKVTSNNSHAT